MNKKYERYINYIVDELELPYFKNMKDNYGLGPDEYELVLSRVFNQPVSIGGKSVENIQDQDLYFEDALGYWQKTERNDRGDITYEENSDGNWSKREYDEQGYEVYYEDSDGTVIDYR